jgi:hypothetical protein
METQLLDGAESSKSATDNKNTENRVNFTYAFS